MKKTVCVLISLMILFGMVGCEKTVAEKEYDALPEVIEDLSSFESIIDTIIARTEYTKAYVLQQADKGVYYSGTTEAVFKNNSDNLAKCYESIITEYNDYYLNIKRYCLTYYQMIAETCEIKEFSKASWGSYSDQLVDTINLTNEEMMNNVNDCLDYIEGYLKKTVHDKMPSYYDEEWYKVSIFDGEIRSIVAMEGSALYTDAVFAAEDLFNANTNLDGYFQ